MSVTLPDLESYLNALGDPVLLVGDPFTVGGLEELGAKEGDVSIAWNPRYNNLTFEEYTGDAPHEASVQGFAPVVSIPTILGNEALWAKMSATGLASGGHSHPQPVQETSLVIAPLRELQAGDFGYTTGDGWTPVAPGEPRIPKNWVWFWRVYLQLPDFAFRNPDGGKSVGTINVTVMHDKARPEGHKLWTIGDPAAQGITDLAI